MKQLKCIIATHSFILNRGLSGILKEFRNVIVSEIVEDLKTLETGLKSHKPDFVVISSELLSEIEPVQINRNYQASPATKLIHLKTNSFSNSLINVQQIITLNASRKETADFFSNLFDKYLTDEWSNGRDISDREKSILGLVARGKTNKEIAEDLNISIHTVITHRKNITAKLGIKSISGLTVYAIFNGIISMTEVE